MIPYRKAETRSSRCLTIFEILVAMIVTHFLEELVIARIEMLRALNRHVERVFNPDRKDPHWGWRKLARDR